MQLYKNDDYSKLFITLYYSFIGLDQLCNKQYRKYKFKLLFLDYLTSNMYIICTISIKLGIYI